MATFDDLIYEDYGPIMQYLLNMFCVTKNGYASETLVDMLKYINRLDILEHISVIDDNGNKISGTNLIK